MRYVADDGTEFKTEQECLDYENYIKDIKNCFIAYGEKLNKLSEEECSNNSIYYIDILNKPNEVSDYLYHEYDIHLNLTEDIQKGIYVYDHDCVWRHIDYLINYYQEYLKKCQEIKNTLQLLSEIFKGVSGD